MKRVAWIITGLLLAVLHGVPVRAGSLEVQVEPGRVTLQADEVPLADVVRALSRRAAVHVLLDAQRAAQPVTVRLEAGGVQEAIVRLMREAGAGNYAILSSNDQGNVETFAFHEGGGAPGASPTIPPAPRTRRGRRRYAVGDGSTYAPAAMDRDKTAAAPTLDAGDPDRPAAPRERHELAAEEYKEQLEITRSRLEKGAEKGDGE